MTLDANELNCGPELRELVEQLHKQNIDHDRHGYDGWKKDCPTCDLLGKFAAAAALSAVVSKAEGPVRGGQECRCDDIDARMGHDDDCPFNRRNR